MTPEDDEPGSGDGTGDGGGDTPTTIGTGEGVIDDSGPGRGSPGRSSWPRSRGPATPATPASSGGGADGAPGGDTAGAIAGDTSI